MVFRAIDNVLLGSRETGREEDIRPKCFEQFVEQGRGSGLKGREGP